jgi:hypothetical protein
MAPSCGSVAIVSYSPTLPSTFFLSLWLLILAEICSGCGEKYSLVGVSLSVSVIYIHILDKLRNHRGHKEHARCQVGIDRILLL